MMRMEHQFETIWGIMQENDAVINQSILCTLIDHVAGQDNQKGYEMIETLLPIMRIVGDEMGVANV